MVLAVVAVAVAGLPLSLLVTPLLALVALLGAHIADLAGAGAPAVDRVIGSATASVLPALQDIGNGRWPPMLAMAAAAVPLVLPGAAVMLVFWLAIRRLLAGAGAGGVLLMLEAREPHAADFEEHQLGNLVEEMAIAAGLPPPRLRILDSTVPNAAVVGTTPQDASLVVSRGLLDALDRDEAQGVIADLVAAVGDGDLHIAGILLSVEQTFGLLLAVLNAPFGPRSRHLIGSLVRAGFGGAGSERAVALVADLLADAPDDEADDDAGRYADRAAGRTGTLRTILRLPVIPLLFVATAARIIMLLTAGAIFAPTFAALWRRRRRLADAMAVQLTRNPDGLARALDRLRRTEHHLPGAGAAAHLFVVWEPGGNQAGGRVFGGTARVSPSIQRRCLELQRMGAAPLVPARSGRRPAGSWRWISVLGLLVLLPLLLLMAYLLVLIVIGLVLLNFLFLGLLLLGLTAALDVVFAAIAHLMA